jgi:hypothetical protein
MRPCLPSILSLIFLLLIGAPGKSAAESPWATGESGCSSCHRERSKTQPQTPMGRALALPGSNPVLQDIPKLTTRKGAYTYTVETQNGQSTYTVSDGSHSVTVPLHWNFGAHAQTWVLEHNGKRYESTVSYYPSKGGLDFTIGNADLKPTNVEEAIGREIDDSETVRCFGCHASNAVVKGRLTLDTLQPGVTCEHCHAGSVAHMSDALNGDFESAPPDIRKLSAEHVSNFCGQCHRTWETVIRNNWRGTMTVRFQPYRIANSKCFDGADPRISCIACHDPHVDVVRQDASYDGKCLACHGEKPASVKSASGLAGDHAANCPLAKSDCARCHMPKVTLPSAQLTFTDHQIRIVKPGESFPN